MVDLRQAISPDLIRFHIVRDSDRRCSYLFTNGICGQYTSIITRERMLCHIPQRKDDCNYGSRLEERNEATDQRQAFCFYHHRLYLCQNTRVKVFEPVDKRTSSYNGADEPELLPLRRSRAMLLPPQRKFRIASIARGAVLYLYNPYSSISKYLCFTFCLALNRFTFTCYSVRFRRAAIFL